MADMTARNKWPHFFVGPFPCAIALPMHRITSEVLSSAAYAPQARNGQPNGRLRDRSVTPGSPAALPVFPLQPVLQVQTDNQVVEGRTDQRVRPDVSSASQPPTDILRRAESLGVLKEIQDTAASLISERREDTPAEDSRHGLHRSARRYLGLKLAESCLEHGEDDASISRWLGVNLGMVDRRRLPLIQEELRELETSPDRATALGTFHAALAAEGAPDARGFVASYLQQMQQVRSFGARLTLLIRNHPVGDLIAVVRQMLVALRADLEAALPSREPRWLARVLQDMGHMHLTSTLVEQLKELQTFMESRQDPMQRHPMDARALLGELVGLVEQGTAVPSQIERMVDAAGARLPQERIQLLVGLRRILMALPARLFNDTAHQTLLVGCVQHCLDQAIEAEEAAADAPPGTTAP